MVDLKRSISIKGHRTSVSLEKEFWNAFQNIAVREQKTIPILISEIDDQRGSNNLSSAIRVYILKHHTQG